MEKNQIEVILNNLINSDFLRVQLMFCRKAKTGYTSYMPNISNAIKEDLVNLIRDNLENKKRLRPVTFNPIRSCMDDEFEYCTTDYVGNFQEVKDSFQSPDVVDTGLSPADLTFYCLKVCDENDTFCYNFYRRVTKFRRLESKGLLAYFSGNALNKIEQQMLGIDGFVDLICYENNIMIFNHIALERIFRLNEKFTTKATEALEILGKTNRISNFEQFENDCLADARYHKTLSRMLEEHPNISDVLVNNFSNVREVIDTFDLNIEISEGNPPQIIYEFKEQRMDILRIINDAYCRSIICDRRVVHDN